MSHTPGPWTLEMTEDGDESGGYGTDSWTGEIITAPCEENPDGDQVCQVWPMDKANAHLIAAAPDLLAACEAMAAAKDLLGLMGAQMHAREALKKAKGGA